MGIIMATAAKATTLHSKREAPTTMLLKFKHKDTVMGVQKQTVKRMAELLGFNETDVVHYALSKLAREVIPAYEMDDGPLTESQINKIKALSGIDQNLPMTSILFG
jgi:hypothetical protein